ncbi:MAG: exodeoxyribonuclease VII small subunit [Tissierellia bacterium]|nr:exodeoxyribonuclease VII small subunit [Tissierellia bacterium]
MKFDNFENALEELKKIVQIFEDNDNITIDELLSNYEKGMEAYHYCSKKLDDTRKKIKIIDENFE